MNNKMKEHKKITDERTPPKTDALADRGDPQPPKGGQPSLRKLGGGFGNQPHDKNDEARIKRGNMKETKTGAPNPRWKCAGPKPVATSTLN